MKTSSKIIIVFLCFIFGQSIVMLSLLNQYFEQKRETERIYSAFQTEQEVLKRIETLEGNIAVQTKVIALKADELNSLYPDIKKEIQNLKVKVNRVEQVSQTSFHSEKQITTLIKDTLITDTIKAKVFNYNDEYFTIKGISVLDIQKVDISMRDTLVQVVYWGQRKKPYLWIFSKRQLEQRVSLKNPDSHIEYSKVIKIQK